MNNLLIAAIILGAFLTSSAPAQVKSETAKSNTPASKQAPANTNANATRSRTMGPNLAAPSVGQSSGAQSLQAYAKTDVKNHAEVVRSRTTGKEARVSSAPGKEANGGRQLANDTTKSLAAEASPVPAISSASTQVYRVGALDVLDIQLAENPNQKSTLFTIRTGGLLEYPLAGDPIAVVGLTTSEIAALLKQRIKIFENPSVTVTVRDFASHSVTVAGFVAAPGKKILRREAVPLYALLAEALILPEAARATITRQGRPSLVVDITDPNHASTLVTDGDVIKVSGMPPSPNEFFFIGGAINSPGQKAYHAGLTLTQAILASGGVNDRAGTIVRVSRLGANGRLITEEHNLRRIQAGRLPDPVMKKGDRIEVLSTN